MRVVRVLLCCPSGHVVEIDRRGPRQTEEEIEAPIEQRRQAKRAERERRRRAEKEARAKGEPSVSWPPHLPVREVIRDVPDDALLLA